MNWIKTGEDLVDLKSIRVFDSQSAQHYVAKEGAIEYKPIGVHLLDELINTCAYVKEQAEGARRKLQQVTALPQLSLETEIGKFVSSLNKSSTAESIDERQISEEQKESILNKQQELFNLKSKTAEQLKAEVKKEQERIKPLITFIKKLWDTFNDDALKKLVEQEASYKEKFKALDELRIQTFQDSENSFKNSSEWSSMLTAVEKYLISIGKKAPLDSDDDCPFCLQRLGVESATKLQGIYDFVRSELSKEVDEEKTKLEDLKKLACDQGLLLDPYLATLDELEEKLPGIKEKIKSWIKLIGQRKAVMCAELINLDSKRLDVKNELISLLEGYFDTLKSQEEGMASDEKLATTIKSLELEIKELTDLKVFSENKENYLKEIERQSKLDKINSIISQTNTISVTKLNTQINQTNLITNLQKSFLEELKKFGFKNFNVEVSTRGERGNQLLKINISDINITPHEIASEGEQKCLALASFLAEIDADDKKSAIVLDDPVNSLAHRWRGKFAKRIVEESKIRQVIVFSHDLPFIKMLEESSCDQIQIRALDRKGLNSGHVLERPHWDTMNTKARVGELKQVLVKLKKSEANDSEKEYHEKVKDFYSKKRGAWERLVEELLLKKVVERFGRSVSTMSLRYLVDINDYDIKTIDAAMSKCSGILDGHDSASELGLEIMPYEDVESDFLKLEDYFKTLKKRRN